MSTPYLRAFYCCIYTGFRFFFDPYQNTNTSEMHQRLLLMTLQFQGSVKHTLVNAADESFITTHVRFLINAD